MDKVKLDWIIDNLKISTLNKKYIKEKTLFKNNDYKISDNLYKVFWGIESNLKQMIGNLIEEIKNLKQTTSDHGTKEQTLALRTNLQYQLDNLNLEALRNSDVSLIKTEVSLKEQEEALVWYKKMSVGQVACAGALGYGLLAYYIVKNWGSLSQVSSNYHPTANIPANVVEVTTDTVNYNYSFSEGFTKTTEVVTEIITKSNE